ncbi:MAG: DUF6600 domain-containing protein [Candidatus Korobacteraceae bacterium]
MKSWQRWQGMLMVLLLVVMSAGAVFAQDQNDAPPPANVPVQQGDPGQGAQQQDPPGRVARVQFMSGQVSMQPGGVNDWIAASMNRPLTTSDRVWTDKDSKAELNVGDGFIRMNSETSLTLTNVSDNTVQIELDQGTLSVTVKHLERGEIYEVDTPNYAFTVMKSGVYRFDVYPSQDQSWVTVRSGYGEATGKGAAVRVNSGMQVRFTSDQSLQHTAYQAPARDGFDDWAQVRDKRLDDSVSARYVSPGVIGYQDLDANGQWVQAPTYGAVWVPSSVPAGWAPYRYGHWVWIAPWGWTWVDDQPWGFAPFHYGRWVSYGGGWGWAPGPYGGYWNPYYAPALVGWIGGPGFGVGFGWGGGWGGFGIGINFGWFPLGWGEPFFPRYCGWGRGGWYRGGGFVTGNYFRNVNSYNTHITNINNFSNNYFHGNINNTHYGFRNTAGAVTAAPRSAFTSGAAINRVGGAVPKSELGKGSMLRGVDANPTRESVLGGRSPQTRGTPPASAFGRSVVTRSQPPARPASVEGNQSAIARGNNTPSANHGMNAETSRAGSANLGATRPQTGGNEGARTASPASAAAGHNVPRPPSAGGMNASRVGSPANNAAGMATHNVPRPPTSDDSFARGNSNTLSNRQPTNLAQGHNPPEGSAQRSGTNGWTPQPKEWSQTSRPGGTQPSSAPSRSAGSYSTPQGNNRGGAGASSVPRPPAGYSYHAAPAYSGSSAYGARSPWASPSGGSSRSSYPSSGYSNRSSYPSSGSSAYNGRSSYPSAGYGAGRSYSPAPNYSASRSYGSMPSYSGHSAGSYSAPHNSGGGGGSHASGGSYHGGGGGSHGGGGGGHSGGGGHGR